MSAADPAREQPVVSLAAEITRIVETRDGERDVTRAVAEVLASWLADGPQLAPELCRPDPERYAMYPLHIDPDERFSIAAAVWGVGQGTPVHGHETWGVVGIYSGTERESRYTKPRRDGERPQRLVTRGWPAGAVTVCCTTDDDVHQVSCAGFEPCVGIHVYGADIGRLPRRSYDARSGAPSWFTSTWARP